MGTAETGKTSFSGYCDFYLNHVLLGLIFLIFLICIQILDLFLGK